MFTQSHQSINVTYFRLKRFCSVEFQNFFFPCFYVDPRIFHSEGRLQISKYGLKIWYIFATKHLSHNNNKDTKFSEKWKKNTLQLMYWGHTSMFMSKHKLVKELMNVKILKEAFIAISIFQSLQRINCSGLIDSECSKRIVSLENPSSKAFLIRSSLKDTNTGPSKMHQWPRLKRTFS